MKTLISLIWVCTVCPDLSVRKLYRIITVDIPYIVLEYSSVLQFTRINRHENIIEDKNAKMESCKYKLVYSTCMSMLQGKKTPDCIKEDFKQLLMKSASKFYNLS